MHPVTAGINNIIGNISNKKCVPLHPLNTYNHEAIPITNNKSANITLVLVIILINSFSHFIMIDMPDYAGYKGHNN